MHLAHGKMKDSIYMYIFHNKGNNSRDGLTSPVTILMDGYSGNVVDFRGKSVNMIIISIRLQQGYIDDLASLSTFLLTVWTFKSKSNTHN